jgi:predicted lipid-binding transport protein (Tim44 family)
MVTLVSFAAGGLIAGSLSAGLGHGVGGGDAGFTLLDLWLGGGGIVALLVFLRRRQAARAQPARAAASVASHIDTPSDPAMTADDPNSGSSFDRGLRDIRRADPGFDPSRFAGYTGMVFRDAQAAWMARDIGGLRDRLTPQMYGALQAQSDGLRDAGHANRVERIEITAEITEAWQESGRDYVTASIVGSIVDYTVDEANDRLVHGSKTTPRDIEEFWTFTRPAGLNFWMLSAIQSAIE